jgi:hypothetical protein
VPDGLSFSQTGATTAEITGTPTTPGIFSTSVQADDGVNPPVVVSFSWTIRSAGGVTYRVNAGGPVVPASNGLADWQVDTGFANTGNPFSTQATISADSTVPTGTPLALFATERFDLPEGPELSYAFPVVPGAAYEVRLYFAEIYSSAAGQRVFDVSIEGTMVLDDFDILAFVAPDVGTMRAHTLTAGDDTLNIEFDRVVDNPVISAIEIIDLSDSNAPPTLSNPGDQSDSVDVEIVPLAFTASDLDSDPLTLTASGVPDGLSFSQTGATTAEITGTPTTPGIFTMSVQVDDGVNPPVVVFFDWTIRSAASVIHRVNAGGSVVPASDGLGDWEADGNFANTGRPFATQATVSADSTVPDGTPLTLFAIERFDLPQAPELSYAFPVVPGTAYEVRLYFAEIYSSAAGQRVFDVSIEGTMVLDDFDILASGAPNVGTMRSHTLTAGDDTLTINFIHVVDNPVISAIEIVDLDGSGSRDPTPVQSRCGLLGIEIVVLLACARPRRRRSTGSTVRTE